MLRPRPAPDKASLPTLRTKGKHHDRPVHLDLKRLYNSHLVFGANEHFLYGNQLARLVGQITIFESGPAISSDVLGLRTV
jgi:hypothetical protein